MATYYVRKTGSDGNAGTSAGAAWLTIGKALGASGISSGDTVYVGAGTYREAVTVNMTSAVAETFIIADVDGRFTGDPGEIVWTAYTTNDFTAPTASATLNLNARDFLTFRKFTVIGGNSDPCCIVATTTTSVSCKFEDCSFFPGSNAGSDLIKFTNTAAVAFNNTFDRCRFVRLNNIAIIVLWAISGSVETDLNFQIRNCLFLGGTDDGANADQSAIFVNAGGGAGIFGSGGVDAVNCTSVGGNYFMRVMQGSNTFPDTVTNSALIGGGLYSASTGLLTEDFNIIQATTPRFNVTAGGSSISDGSYSLLFHIGQEITQAKSLRHIMTPTVYSPFLGYGNTSALSVDLLNAPRPAGPAITWSTASASIGCLEYGNSGELETLTFNSTPGSLKIRGPGYHDFDVVVSTGTSALTINGRFNSSYAGTKPQILIMNGYESGIGDSSITMTASANSWETLTTNITATSKGMITLRLQSNTTLAAGIAYFDDFILSSP